MEGIEPFDAADIDAVNVSTVLSMLERPSRGVNTSDTWRPAPSMVITRAAVVVVTSFPEILDEATTDASSCTWRDTSKLKS